MRNKDCNKDRYGDREINTATNIDTEAERKKERATWSEYLNVNHFSRTQKMEDENGTRSQAFPLCKL